MDKIHISECPSCSSKVLRRIIKTKDFTVSKEPFEIWSCDACDFAFTQDAPGQEAIAPYYNSQSYISHSDTKEGFINKLYHRVRSYMLERKYKLIKQVSNGKKLLDYGSGTGYFPAYMQSKSYEVTAMELDTAAREYAKNQFNLDVLPIENLDTDPSEEIYDVITLWHVLEHLYDPKTYINKFHKKLKKEGKLVIAVPNYDSSDGDHYQQFWAAYDVPRHLWHFTPKTIHAFLSSEGFILHSKHKMPFDAFYVSLLSEKYKMNTQQMIRGFLQGTMSYIRSYANVDRCSSVIYVFEKK